jgi:hypothetical protein
MSSCSNSSGLEVAFVEQFSFSWLLIDGCSPLSYCWLRCLLLDCRRFLDALSERYLDEVSDLKSSGERKSFLFIYSCNYTPMTSGI